MGFEHREDGAGDAAGLIVAFPCVDGVAFGAEVEFVDGLAEGAVGDAVECAELDEGARTHGADEIHRKGDMLGPAGNLEPEREVQADGMLQGVNHLKGLGGEGGHG